MTDFKVNDKIERLKPQTVTGVTREGYLEIDNEAEYHHCPDEFKLSPPKPIYQNPPHKHVDMICHVANGGVARNITLNRTINKISDCAWYINDEFEIVQPKTEEDKRIEQLDRWRKVYQDQVSAIDKELAEIKPTVHY